MIKSLKNTNLFKSLNLNKDIHHAYLFSSQDKELNNEIALLFAKYLICEKKCACGECFACKQFDTSSHPDFVLLNQAAIKVEDANNIIEKLATKPISNDYKVFVILNAENINEISQNKLLKSLEEPNPTTIFILSTSKLDKLLPTVLSRLHKINVPSLHENDLRILLPEINQGLIDIEKYAKSNLSLTDILNIETNDDHKKTLSTIKYIFENLSSSQDIPKISSSLPDFNKTLFLPMLQKIFLSCINNHHSVIDNDLVIMIKSNFPQKALINSLSLIEDAHKKQMSNVNFGYILDNLIFNILKEKFLCKQ